VLSALDDKFATLVLSEHNQRVPIEEVSRDWFGDFTIVWKPKTSRTRELSVGMHGDEVRWLRRSLAALHGASSDPEHGDLYDEELANRGAEFSARASPQRGRHRRPANPSRTRHRLGGTRLAAAAADPTAQLGTFMSFILDALKKSELERQRQSVPGLADSGVARPRPRLPAWPFALGLLLAVNLLVLLFVLTRSFLASPHAPPRGRHPAAPRRRHLHREQRIAPTRFYGTPEFTTDCLRPGTTGAQAAARGTATSGAYTRRVQGLKWLCPRPVRRRPAGRLSRFAPPVRRPPDRDAGGGGAAGWRPGAGACGEARKLRVNTNSRTSRLPRATGRARWPTPQSGRGRATPESPIRNALALPFEL